MVTPAEPAPPASDIAAVPFFRHVDTLILPSVFGRWVAGLGPAGMRTARSVSINLHSVSPPDLIRLEVSQQAKKNV